MDVRLRPLRDDEFTAWRERTLAWYAKDLVAHAGMTEAEARKKAETDASAYPRSPSDEGHSIFIVEEEGTGETVGTVWYAQRELRGARKAWVYSLEIDESRRGRGYGRRTMELVEEEARSVGLDRIELNVFGGNEIARSLYRSLGYAELSVWMGKDLLLAQTNKVG